MDRIAIVDGIRTPFVKAWTLFEDIHAQALGTICARELLESAHLNPDLVDEVIFGAVAQPVEASNVARVISLYAGIPEEKRAYTVSRNCASGFESVTSGLEKITCGPDEIVIAGGAESMSNIPLIFGKKITKILMRLNKAKNIIQKLGLLASIKPSYLKPVVGLALGLSDPVCGLNMGQTAEVLAKEFGISRREQDEFALLSHKRAVASKEIMKEEILPVFMPPDFNLVV
ncbi:MAG: acetyl-CoA C-acyltransferase, partial [Candidatus Omnitrophota bacterium]|nr:acetyl-CoA C-acyltransferase [Candidatus Omnitrophota bacterium]